MIKLPSLKTLIEIAQNTFYRFPFVLLSASVGTILAVYSIDLVDDSPTQETYIRGILTCALGISLFIVLTLISEKKQWKSPVHYGAQIGGVILLLTYFYFLPHKNSLVSLTRFFLLAIALHLLVSFFIFLGKNTLNAFWQFNKALFLRILFSALYSGTLYLGLILAVAAIDKLFEIELKPTVYAKLWFCMVGIVNTWFFLGGIPKNIQELEEDTSFPKGLKVFTQYVLLPLVTVYLTILYCYMAKIGIQGHLPVGWVSNLVIGFSIAGIFSLLLIYPIRNLEGNTWIRTYSKWFYLALFPLIILLFVAIGKRVSDYGITENRYFIIVIALWLLGIAIYFTISKAKNIKVIPISLCCIAFLTSFGPWGAFSVSERSQMGRLETLLKTNGILVNGKIQKLSTKLESPVVSKISSIIEYLNERKRFETLQKWVEPANYSSVDSDSSSVQKVMELMGLDYMPYVVHMSEDGTTFNYVIDHENRLTDIKGYNSFIKVDLIPKYSRERKLHNAGDSVNVMYASETGMLNVVVSGKNVISFDLKRISEDLNAKNYHLALTAEQMTFYEQGDSVSAKLLLHVLRGGFSNPTAIDVEYIKADIFLKNH